MKIYHYDRETGEYTGSSQAEQSPLDPGNYLVPAYATDKPAPQCNTDEAAIFVDGDWRVVTDYRGVSVCALDADGIFTGVIELPLGEVPDDRRIVANPPDAELSKPKWDGHAWVDGRSEDERTAARQAEIKEALSRSDRGMIRTIDDLIMVLIEKKVIAQADLPSAVRTKLSERSTLREQFAVELLIGKE